MPVKEKNVNRLLSHPQEELNPVGLLEELPVEKTAVSYWRKRRSVRAEAGEPGERSLDPRRHRSDRRSGTLTLTLASAVDRINHCEIAIDRRLHKAIGHLTERQFRRRKKTKERMPECTSSNADAQRNT